MGIGALPFCPRSLSQGSKTMMFLPLNGTFFLTRGESGVGGSEEAGAAGVSGNIGRLRLLQEDGLRTEMGFCSNVTRNGKGSFESSGPQANETCFPDVNSYQGLGFTSVSTTLESATLRESSASTAEGCASSGSSDLKACMLFSPAPNTNIFDFMGVDMIFVLDEDGDSFIAVRLLDGSFLTAIAIFRVASC
jgi:hypothetical protein